MGNVIFKLDRIGGADILRNNTILSGIEQNAFASIISQIEGDFLTQFGIKGDFAMSAYTNDRKQFLIKSASKQTTAILKANPGWLGRYINDIDFA